ncbi:hypothetical protein F7734_04970 [Scytonema sp. UIC 10036]|uniref:hypothetical protein n=1 Tax=Scytonema sp. UIC 10036 TaxID=2304196 RepID=UPI0012DA663D|nr:hypothetical protein [Scytonema sp. UIC 10036]MUG91858.1 hypothetical protein [Scytonema sp. UIC 10036]
MKSRLTFCIFCLSISLLAGLSTIFTKSKVLAQTEQIVQINVKIVDGNPRGNLKAPRSFGWKNPWFWDAAFPRISFVNPDLGITVIDTNSNYFCKSPVTGFKLEDTLACVFTGVQIVNGTARLAIIDYDVLEHDLIGSGTCGVGQTCRIGQAEVTVIQVPCGDREIQVNYPSEPEYIQAYNGRLSGYHRYPSEGKKIESRICSTSLPGCTRQSVFETMLSQVRFIAPTTATDPVENCKITNLNIPLVPAGDDPILTIIDNGTFSIKNYTRAAHALHSGVVTRTVLEISGFVYVNTFGEGYGLFPTANNLLATDLWQDVDAGLVKAMQEKLDGKQNLFKEPTLWGYDRQLF